MPKAAEGGIAKTRTDVDGLDQITGGSLPKGRPTPELADNRRSLGFDLMRLKRQKRVVVDHVRVERSEIDETGEFDLEGHLSNADRTLVGLQLRPLT